MLFSIEILPRKVKPFGKTFTHDESSNPLRLHDSFQLFSHYFYKKMFFAKKTIMSYAAIASIVESI